MNNLTFKRSRWAGCALAITFAAASWSPAGMDDVIVVKDVPYREGESLTAYERERCKLDLYLPDERAKPFPVVVWFYGGGLTGGEKSGNEALGRKLAANGIAMVSVNYRLSPRVTYPAYNQDAAASVAWTITHIAGQGGDVNRIFVGGHSAGGYLAAIVGFDKRLLAAHGLSPEHLAGLIPVAPQVFTHFTIRRERGIDNPETTPLIDDAAPAFHVRKDAPPMLILLGEHDWPVRLEECQYFVSMLRHLGDTDATLKVIDNRDHGSIAGSMTNDGDPAFEQVRAFIQSHRRANAATQPSSQPAASTTRP